MMEDVCEVADEAGTAVGTYADDVSMARRWAEVGVQYLMVSVVAAELTWRLEEMTEEIRR